MTVFGRSATPKKQSKDYEDRVTALIAQGYTQDQALELTEDKAGSTQGPSMSSEPEVTVELRWSEVRWYTARISRTDLAEAVAEFGPDGPGHPLPGDLSDLKGDPFEHGDLNGLLCELEDEDTFQETDGVEVTSVRVVQ